MEKRYQVFVSSTFTDLIDERRAVMQALLELNCIPAGMEHQWTLIQLAGEEVRIASPSFQTVKIQFYALGLVRMEKLLSSGFPQDPPQPALCWALTDSGRVALADLLAEKRP